MSAASLQPFTVLLKDDEGDIGLSRVLARSPEEAVAHALAKVIVLDAEDQEQDYEEALEKDGTFPLHEMTHWIQGVVCGHVYNDLHRGLDLRASEERIGKLRDAAVRAAAAEDEDVRYAIGVGAPYPEGGEA